MSDLPYSNATSGEKALDEIKKILRGFGCSKFASGANFETSEVFVQFEHQGRRVSISVGAKGYAAAWLKENPWNNRRKSSQAEWQQKALEIGEVAIYSIIRDWVKATSIMIQIDAMKFDAAFLAHIMLPNGRIVMEEIDERKLLQLQ